LTDSERQPVERRSGGRRREDRELYRAFEQRIVAEQDERRRLALFLHDGAVQSLAGIALMLDAVGHSIDAGRLDHAKEVLASALDRHRQTIQSLRDLSFNLEPIVLRDQGLEAAVLALADQEGLVEEIQIDVDVAAAEAMGETAQVALYQFIRETLAQAVSRRPTTISIVVSERPDGEIALLVDDDGRPERRRSTVEAIDERVRTLRGSVEVVRRDDGTAITVVLPSYVARR
jgi:signal transduction histidine kinase